MQYKLCLRPSTEFHENSTEWFCHWYLITDGRTEEYRMHIEMQTEKKYEYLPLGIQQTHRIQKQARTFVAHRIPVCLDRGGKPTKW
jgi:hypothetical protein